jgi:hypothetical protein
MHPKCCNFIFKALLFRVQRRKRQKTKTYPSIHDWWFYVQDGENEDNRKSACVLTKVENGSIVTKNTDYSKSSKHC